MDSSLIPYPCPTKVYHQDTYPAISPDQPHLSKAGKSVFISGARITGIGGGTAVSLARAGASPIALFGRNEAALNETKEAVAAAAPKAAVHIYVGDLLKPSSVYAALTDFAGKTPSGKIDILIAGNGYMSDLVSIADSDPAEWWLGFETSILGNFHLLRAYLAHAAPGGAIVHVGTAATQLPYMPGFSSYRASKAGAAWLFDYVADENPALDVFQVHPGLIKGSELNAKASELTKNYPGDTNTLSGDFINWITSPEGRFLRGRRLIWANWDVESLKAQEEEVVNNPRKFGTLYYGLP